MSKSTFLVYPADMWPNLGIQQIKNHNGEGYGPKDSKGGEGDVYRSPQSLSVEWETPMDICPPIEIPASW